MFRLALTALVAVSFVPDASACAMRRAPMQELRLADALEEIDEAGDEEVVAAADNAEEVTEAAAGAALTDAEAEALANQPRIKIIMPVQAEPTIPEVQGAEPAPTEVPMTAPKKPVKAKPRS